MFDITLNCAKNFSKVCDLNLFFQQAEGEWKIVFYIAAGVYLFGSIVYWLFASGELQPWAVQKKKRDISLEKA